MSFSLALIILLLTFHVPKTNTESHYDIQKVVDKMKRPTCAILSSKTTAGYPVFNPKVKLTRISVKAVARSFVGVERLGIAKALALQIADLNKYDYIQVMLFNENAARNDDELIRMTSIATVAYTPDPSLFLDDGKWKGRYAEPTENEKPEIIDGQLTNPVLDHTKLSNDQIDAISPIPIICDLSKL